MGSRVLVILGMHRSGTSMLTHWLHACGLQVGEALLGPGVGNLQGHFEDLQLYRFHRSWLERHRLPHTGYVTAPLPPLAEPERQALRDLLDARNERFAQWGFKDPRTCLFLDAYRRLLPDAHYLVIFRDFRETVSSLILRGFRQKDQKYATRGGLRGWWWFAVRRRLRWRRVRRRDAARFAKVWICYNRQILAGLREVAPSRQVVVAFRNLVHDGGNALFTTLTARWGFALHHVPLQSIYRPRLVSQALDLEPWIGARVLAEADAVQEQLEALASARRPGAVALLPTHARPRAEPRPLS